MADAQYDQEFQKFFGAPPPASAAKPPQAYDQEFQKFFGSAPPPVHDHEAAHQEHIQAVGDMLDNVRSVGDEITKRFAPVPIPPMLDNTTPDPRNLLQRTADAGLNMAGAALNAPQTAALGLGHLAQGARGAMGMETPADIATPTVAAPTPGREMAQGANQVFKGGMDALMPFAGGAASTVRGAAALGGGMAMQAGVQKGLESVGVSPEYAELGGNVAGLAGGAAIHGGGGDYAAKFKDFFGKEAPSAPVAKVEAAPAEAPAAEAPAVRSSGKPANRPQSPFGTDEKPAANAPAEVGQEAGKLPAQLAGAKPRYSYGKNQFDVKLDDDVDRASWITAQKTASKQDAKYLKFVQDETGWTEEQVREHGAKVREAVKQAAVERLNQSPLTDDEGNQVSRGPLKIGRQRPTEEAVQDEAEPVAGTASKADEAKPSPAQNLRDLIDAANRALGKKVPSVDEGEEVTTNSLADVLKRLSQRKIGAAVDADEAAAGSQPKDAFTPVVKEVLAKRAATAKPETLVKSTDPLTEMVGRIKAKAAAKVAEPVEEVPTSESFEEPEATETKPVDEALVRKRPLVDENGEPILTSKGAPRSRVYGTKIDVEQQPEIAKAIDAGAAARAEAKGQPPEERSAMMREHVARLNDSIAAGEPVHMVYDSSKAENMDAPPDPATRQAEHEARLNDPTLSQEAAKSIVPESYSVSKGNVLVHGKSLDKQLSNGEKLVQMAAGQKLKTPYSPETAGVEMALDLRKGLDKLPKAKQNFWALANRESPGTVFQRALEKRGIDPIDGMEETKETLRLDRIEKILKPDETPEVDAVRASAISGTLKTPVDAFTPVVKRALAKKAAKAEPGFSASGPDAISKPVLSAKTETALAVSDSQQKAVKTSPTLLESGQIEPTKPSVPKSDADLEARLQASIEQAQARKLAPRKSPKLDNLTQMPNPERGSAPMFGDLADAIAKKLGRKAEDDIVTVKGDDGKLISLAVRKDFKGGFQGKTSDFRTPEELSKIAGEGWKEALAAKGYSPENVVGSADFTPRQETDAFSGKESKSMQPGVAFVEPDFRRQGIASRMYDEAAKSFPEGHTLSDSPIGRKSDGQAFRAAYDRNPERGSAPILGDIAQAVHDKFKGDENKPKANYSGMGAIRSKFAPNAAELRAAAPDDVYAAVRTATAPKQQAAVKLIETMPKIEAALGKDGPSLTDFKRVMVQDRLNATRDTWQAWAKDAESLPDKALLGSLQKGVNGLLWNMEAKNGMPVDLLQQATALADNGDIAGLRTMLKSTFEQAAGSVKDVMSPDDFVEHSNKAGFQRGLDVYKAELEPMLEKQAAKTEGAFATTKGEFDTYYPLQDSTEVDATRINPLKERLNQQAAKSELGLGQYSAETKVLKDSLVKAFRTQDRKGAVDALTGSKMMEELTPGSEAGKVFVWNGKPLKAGTITVDGKTYVTAKAFAKDLEPVFAKSDLPDKGIIDKITGAGIQYAITGLMEPVFHAKNILGTMISRTPFVSKSFVGKTGEFIGRPLTQIVRLATTESMGDKFSQDSIDAMKWLAKNGALGERFGSQTYSKALADLTGGEVHRNSLGPTLSGPKGIDMRARIAVYKASMILEPEASVADRTKMVDQLGQYTRALWSEAQRNLPEWTSSFHVAGTTMYGNALKTGFGSEGIGERGLAGRASGMLFRGALGTTAMWALAYRAYTGKLPWNDEKSKFLKIPVNAEDRYSPLGQALWGTGSEQGYIDFSYVNPLAGRFGRTIGLDKAYETAVLGGSKTQIAEAAQTQMLNSAAHPFEGPILKAAFVAATGNEPYLTGLRDDRGRMAPQFFNITRSGGIPQRGMAAIRSLNPFVENVGEATGMLAPEKVAKGSKAAQMVNDLLGAPFAKPSDPYKKMQFLHKQERGMQRAQEKE